MSFFDENALLSRLLQQVNNGANRAGTWTRDQMINIRRERPKNATADTTATSSTATEKTNGESSKRQSKQSTSALQNFSPTFYPSISLAPSISLFCCHTFSLTIFSSSKWLFSSIS